MTELATQIAHRPTGAGAAPYVLFDTGPLPGGTAFRAPRRLIRATTPDEVAPAFAAMEDAVAEGRWLAGYASYELGYLMDARLYPLLPKNRRVPLLEFGVFDSPETPFGGMVGGKAGAAGIGTLTPNWSADRYRTAFDRLQDYIAAGDVYQANLTFPLTTTVNGTPLSLYQALCATQPVAHGALVDLGGPVLLSRSPELFFRVDRDGRIETRPMKGTAPRGATEEEDKANRDWLRNDAKNRAENLMIVDLLRNDLSRISQLGSVRVPELFSVETYATLHQMTSRIEARLNPGVGILDIFRALFPCGSITGAPKIRAMEIIRELEETPRDAYCGSIGWIGPDGTMDFNVAIRTIMLGEGMLGEGGDARLNVGGGVVHDSTASAEYEEALLKARYARIAP